jgi:hypothetical protein
MARVAAAEEEASDDVGDVAEEPKDEEEEEKLDEPVVKTNPRSLFSKTNLA